MTSPTSPTSSAAVDPLVATVESTTLALFRRLEGSLLHVEDHGDVLLYRSDSDFPLFNGVAVARFAPGRVRDRAEVVLDQMIERRKPFLWWTTNSTRSPELVSVLEERGLVLAVEDPGMHLDLNTRSDLDTPEQTAGVIMVRGDASDVEDTTDVFMHAFALPPDARPYAVDLITGMPTKSGQQMAHVFAQLDGKPAGSGVVMMIDGVAGLYNIGVVDAARRRGVGAAITRELLRIAREHGCRDAVLYASKLGQSVYAAEGFETHGSAANYAWLGGSVAAL